ncbi:MAG: hypothetical protein Q9220_000006 [cf. Caloplaca sp. 1 TL-2023]
MGSVAADPPNPAVDAKSSSSGDVPSFSYYANAQSEFKPPPLANGNAFLGDVFSSSKIPCSILSQFFQFDSQAHKYNSADLASTTSPPISAGFYRLEPGPELLYTYTYDEMKILVQGDMQIAQLEAEKGEGKDKIVKEEVNAKAGDTFFFSKGAVIRFRTKEGGLAWFCGQRKRDGA